MAMNGPSPPAIPPEGEGRAECRCRDFHGNGRFEEVRLPRRCARGGGFESARALCWAVRPKASLAAYDSKTPLPTLKRCYRDRLAPFPDSHTNWRDRTR